MLLQYTTGFSANYAHNFTLPQNPLILAFLATFKAEKTRGIFIFVVLSVEN